MNEFLNRKSYRATTIDPIASPVTEQELADWLALPDATDPTLAPILKAATSSVIRWLGLDLLARDWTLTHNYWPTNGTMSSPSLSGQNGYYKREIGLPYANLLSVTDVALYGDLTTDYNVLGDTVVLDFNVYRTEVDGTNENPAIVISYSAGFGETSADIPDDIKTAITMLAAYNYEHRGGCSAGNALTDSGAASMLTSYRDAGMLF